MGQGTTTPGRPKSKRGSKPKLLLQVGQRIGRGVVLDPDVRDFSRSGRPVRKARLRCDCGEEYVRYISALIGSTRYPADSCGCATRDRLETGIPRPGAVGRAAPNFVDRTGQRVGMLTVVSVASKKPKMRWLCRCDCGGEIVVWSQVLGKGMPNSCGCSPIRKNRLPSGIAGRNRVHRQYRRSARDRGLAWELSDADFDKLIVQDCFYCGSGPSSVSVGEGSRFVYNGIDRVRNDVGYTPDNVVACCFLCNRAKGALSPEVFVAWIGRIAAHQWFQPDQLSKLLAKGQPPKAA